MCSKTLNANEELTSFSAFLPYDHRFGRFSDAAFHKNCFDSDPDANAVNDMYYVFNKIMEGCPKDLKTVEEMETWTKEAFQDWPPKNGVIIMEQCFPEDGQEAEWFWADKDMWEEWDAAMDAADKEREERMEEALRREREAWRYVRDND